METVEGTSDGTSLESAGAEGAGHDASRLDRELVELLNELRVVLPGVQALFAFLLIVPFNDRFSSVGELERVVYVVAFLSSALACALFITAPSFHRLRFRRHDKAQLLRVGNRCAIAGMVFLAVAMSAAVFLVTDLIYGGPLAGALTGIVALALASLWWVLPLVFGRDRD